MSNIQKLQDMLNLFRNSISNYPVGAITLDDNKPIEEKVRNLRQSLKYLNSRLQLLQVKLKSDSSQLNESEIDIFGTDELNTKFSDCMIRSETIKSCIHSSALNDSFSSSSYHFETQRRMKSIMMKLFIMNDKMLEWQKIIVELAKEEIKLKDECTQLIYQFHSFLKQQENIKREKLEALNPDITMKKERVNKFVIKINLMKRLITNFISASSLGNTISPELQTMLKKHRNLISADTLIEMTPDLLED